MDAACGQEWIAAAPAIICIAAVLERTTVKYGNRGRGYVYMEAGHAAESLMLQAVAVSLATAMVGAFSDGEVKRVLHLARNETPLCLIPIGTLKSLTAMEGKVSSTADVSCNVVREIKVREHR